MNVQARPNDTHSTWLDIAVFAAVASFFLFSAHSLTKSMARGNAEQALNAPKAAVPERTLASVETRAPTADDHSIATFRLGCLFQSSPTPLTTDAAIVRIVADLCQTKAPSADNAFKGKNLSSGEDIVPFVQGGKVMSTNYFSLREGSNRISFDLNLGRAKSLHQEFEFVRNKAKE